VLRVQVSQLVELIKRNRRSFEHPPIGPVGSFLTIADSKYVCQTRPDMHDKQKEVIA